MAQVDRYVPRATPYTFVMAPPELEEVTREALGRLPNGMPGIVYDIACTDLLGAAHPPEEFVDLSGDEPTHLPIDRIRRWLAPESLKVLIQTYLACSNMADDERFDYRVTYSCPNGHSFVVHHTVRPLLRRADGTVRLIVTQMEFEPAPTTDEGSTPSA